DRPRRRPDRTRSGHRHDDAGEPPALPRPGRHKPFERDLIRDRVTAGLRRAKAGPPPRTPRRYRVDTDRMRERLEGGLSMRAVGRTLGVPHTCVRRAFATTI